MSRIKAFFFSLHRVSGVIISALFFMWFVTGLVLIYHSFPNVEDSQLNEKKEVLPSHLPPLEEVLSRLSDTTKIRHLRIYQFQEQTLFDVNTKKSTYTFCADSIQKVKPITSETIAQTVSQWVNAPILKIDTLNNRDQWIMYSTYMDKMPIYKFYFDDEEEHQLYIEAQTAEVLQFTDKTERLWAWLGAIPHKLYFPVLRQHTELWIKVLTTLGVVGIIASITGMIVAIFTTRKRYKVKKNLECPYRKRWYRWHYFTGIVFGLFLATWAFSGAMSMQRIPQWVIKTYGDYRVSPKKLRGSTLSLANYRLDYRKVIESYDSVKEISIAHFRSLPIYNVTAGTRTFCIDASTDEVKPLQLSKEQIEGAIKKVYGDTTLFTVSKIDKYEEYYMARKETLPLPAYKVMVDNADKSRFYVDPATGNFQYYNRNRMAKKWVFSGLHYLKIGWLYERPVLWTITIWILCIGGSIVSLTGVWLGIKYIIRKFKRLK